MAISKPQRAFAPPARSLALDVTVRRTLSEAISKSGKSRSRIAEDLTAATGTRVTERMLNQFTAESRQTYRFPAAWVLPFCRITGSNCLQRVLLGQPLSEILRLGENEIEAHRLRTTIMAELCDSAGVES